MIKLHSNREQTLRPGTWYDIHKKKNLMSNRITQTQTMCSDNCANNKQLYAFIDATRISLNWKL